MRKFIILILGCLAFQLAICQNSFIYSFHRTDGFKNVYINFKFMKKFSLVFLYLTMAFVVMSQSNIPDLYFFERVPNYYYGTFWADQIFPYQSGYTASVRTAWAYGYCNIFGTTTTNKMITDHELKVIGIAIAEQVTDHSEYDSLRVNQYRLYKHHDDEMELLGYGEVDYYKSVPRYIFHALQWSNQDGRTIDTTINYSWAVPVYETYFSKPVYVTDSFYIGMTGFNFPNARGAWVYNSFSHPIGMHFRVGNDMYLNPVPQVMYRSEFSECSNPPEGLHLESISTDTNWILHIDNRGCFTFIFPIIDTTYIPNVEIDEEALNQEVTLSPNPTHGMAMLNSDVMIKTFDVYASDGRLVEHKLVNGLVFPLYTDHWARGLYLVHVHTLHGTIVKKLMVQ